MIDVTPNIRAITAAIIEQGIKDAVTGGDPDTMPETQFKERKEAQRWLLGADCEYYCDCLGIDHKLIVCWVHGGCKPLNRRAFMEAANV